MSDNTKLNIEINGNKFEAEGPAEIVNAQFLAFKELMSLIPVSDSKERKSIDNKQDSVISRSSGLSDEQFSSIFTIENELISLRIIPEGGSKNEQVGNGILLLLYAFKAKSLKGVSGLLIDGLQTSGMKNLRVDLAAAYLKNLGYILKDGQSKGTYYTLTNKGLAKAEEIIKGLLDKIN